jgi:hypothetical protein
MRLRASCAFAALLLWAGPALAYPVQVYFSWGSGPTQNTTLGATQLGEVDNSDGTFDYSGSQSTTGWALSWDVTAKPDPFIDAVFGVTNNTGGVQTYSIIFTLPVTPAIPNATAGASVIGNLTVNTGGGTLGHSGTTAMFTTLIDGVPYDTLLPFDSSVTLAFGSGSTGSDDFGLPALDQPAPAVNTSIGIQLTFTLTPGDSASFTGRFEVIPVPEPMRALLAGGGLLAALVFARRRA